MEEGMDRELTRITSSKESKTHSTRPTFYFLPSNLLRAAGASLPHRLVVRILYTLIPRRVEVPVLVHPILDFSTPFA